MTHARLAIVTAAVVFSSAAVASADPITILVDGRRVDVGPILSAAPHSSAQAADTLVAAVTAPPESNALSGIATLTSSFADPLHWSGTGMVSVSWTTLGDMGAATDFFTQFLVTSPVRYSFNGSMAASASSDFGDALVVGGFWVFTGTLDEDGEEIPSPLFNTVVHPFGTHNPDAASPSFSGLLEPGKYEMFILAHTDSALVGPAAAAFGSANANFRFALDFAPADASPTPEPASLMLLATGVAGAFGVRRRSATGRE